MCTPRSIPTPEAGSEKPSGFVMPTAKPGDFPYFVRWWDCYALSGSLLSFKGKHLQSFLTYQESQELVVSCLRLSRRSKFLTDEPCQRATILFETASSWYPGEWVGVKTSDNHNKKSGGRRKQTVWRSWPISLPEVGTILIFHLSLLHWLFQVWAGIHQAAQWTDAESCLQRKLWRRFQRFSKNARLLIF